MSTMEKMMMLTKKETCSVSNTNNSSALGMHRDSKVISKVKPKIRIIHIFAPEIIKTDAANFRELVQRLTGKPTASKKKPRLLAKKEELPTALSNKPMMNITNKLELITGYRSSSRFRDQRIKEEDQEEMMWSGDHQNSSGGFLGGFADLDNFMQELSGGFPLHPLDVSHMDAYGESQLA